MSEEKIDYRAELAHRHKLVDAMQAPPANNEEAEVFVDIMVCDVMISKEILGEMGCRAEITALAKECIASAEVAYPHYNEKELIYNGLLQMEELLFEHPRLKVQLLTLLKRIAIEHKDTFGDPEWIEEELQWHAHNIAMADAGQLDKILPRENAHLKHDPVEWTARWEMFIDEVDEKVEADMQAEGTPRGMGFCYGFWMAREKYLAEYGIQWRSPDMMNPGVMFD